MLQSQLFTRTSKETSKDEVSKTAQLLIRAGFVDKLSAGVYTFLPLGLKVLDKTKRMISEHMEQLSAQEIIMPALIPEKNWKITKRWDNLDVLFKLKGRTDLKYGLGPTHEEVVVPLIKKHILSYKDLPLSVFQVQDKFRDELRAKSGLLRAREFSMKDLYSFHSSEEDLDKFYEKVKESYIKIFEKLGIADQTYLTLASGGTFSKYSHEFQTVTDAGEDTIYICPKCKVATNRELIKDNPKCWNCGDKLTEKKKAIETANIFKLKDKYTKPFDFKFTDQDGKKKLVMMGCYGMGISRLIGAVVEVSHDQKGIIWPQSIAPFKFHLISIGKEKAADEAYKIYKTLQKQGVEVIYDDRQNKGSGEKFADCDLIGVPCRILVSDKTLEKDCVEVKNRNSDKTELIKIKKLTEFVKKYE